MSALKSTRRGDASLLLEMIFELIHKYVHVRKVSRKEEE